MNGMSNRMLKNLFRAVAFGEKVKLCIMISMRHFTPQFPKLWRQGKSKLGAHHGSEKRTYRIISGIASAYFVWVSTISVTS